MRKFTSLVLCFILVMPFAALSASAAQSSDSGIATAAESMSFFQKIINFFNDLINKIRALFGLSVEKENEPLQPVVDNTADVVYNFGAYGDGVHDDTAAIQNALDYMKNSGGTVYFPDGIYMISACLIFYSEQTLNFSENAVLRRAAAAEPAKYMLASYTSSASGAGGYNGVQNAAINGGTFDGNADTSGNLTILNLCHAKNVTVSGASFVNGSYWHYIEIASSSDVLVRNCSFDAESYTLNREAPVDELIQLDVAKGGNYGPIYNVNGSLVNFIKDETPCRNIEIADCVFNCGGAPAIGEHNGYAHTGISIHGNIINGVSARNGSSNGYIKFMEGAKNIEIYENEFNSSAEPESLNKGVVVLNIASDSCRAYENVFNGYFSEYFTDNIVAENNVFN